MVLICTCAKVPRWSEGLSSFYVLVKILVQLASIFLNIAHLLVFFYNNTFRIHVCQAIIV